MNELICYIYDLCMEEEFILQFLPDKAFFSITNEVSEFPFRDRVYDGSLFEETKESVEQGVHNYLYATGRLKS